MFCENCGHQISDTAKFCSACGHPVGTAPSPGTVAPPAVPAKRESPRLKASSGNGSITKMSGTRRKPWLLRMPIPDPHTGITVMKAVGTYVTREEAEAVRAEMMKRPATPYQDSTLQDCFRMFKESREYKGRSDKARELYDIAWKYLRPLWHFKIAALYAQDFQNILDKMADNGLSQSMLEKERTLISKLYRTAIGWRVVDANLASVLKVEGRKSPEREIFTDEQVTLILSQKNTPTGQMVIALLACGVRIYELLHFKHEDFHRTESGAYLIGGCKTEAGRNRIIPILDFGTRFLNMRMPPLWKTVRSFPMEKAVSGMRRTGVTANSILSWRKSASSRILTTKMVSANRSLPGSLPPIRPTPPAIPTPAFVIAQASTRIP